MLLVALFVPFASLAAKLQGKVTNLESAMAPINLKAQLGIAHTRWATHGAVRNIAEEALLRSFV